jgi:hypothetical protein
MTLRVVSLLFVCLMLPGFSPVAGIPALRIVLTCAESGS